MATLRAVCAVAVLASVAHARIHHLTLTDDKRFVMSIEDFGFAPGGVMELTVSSVSAKPDESTHLLGFHLARETAEAQVSEYVDLVDSTQTCLLENTTNAIVLPRELWPRAEFNATIFTGGLYEVLFLHCSPRPSSASFTLDLVMYNPGPNYLSVGEQPLPWMYGIMCMAFAASVVGWAVHLRRNAADVHKIHHLMTLLIVLRTLTLLFEAVMYHFIALTGHSTGWNIAYYIANFARGCVMIAVLALVGAGWSLLKPFLNTREKKVILVALCVQVINNIAIIVVDEISPGSTAYTIWTIILHAADVIAVAVIMVPIVWSINHLRTAQVADSGDDKALNTLKRLTQFRSFYIISICFMYFSRIIVWVLWTAIDYKRQWVPYFFEELSTLAFYAYVGYRFRPATENSDYLRVATDDDEDEVAAAAAAAAGGEVEMTTAVTSGATARMSAPVQTVSRVAPPRDAEDAGEHKPAPAATAGGKGGKQVWIDEERPDDDDFGLDDDDRADGLAVTAPSSGPASATRTGLKNVRAAHVDDD